MSGGVWKCTARAHWHDAVKSLLSNALLTIARAICPLEETGLCAVLEPQMATLRNLNAEDLYRRGRGGRRGHTGKGLKKALLLPLCDLRVLCGK